MSLASLLALYGSPGNQYATAKAVGDITAQTRMRYELAAEVAAEIVPAAQDRILTGVQLNNSIKAYAIVFDGQPNFATSVTVPSQQPVTAKRRMGITRMEHIVGVLSKSLAQLRGEFPTAPGVTNAADAIYPGTRVYAVWDNTPWEVSVAFVTEDNGDDPIEVTVAGVAKTIARSHIHFEYTDAVNDVTMTNVTLYDFYTDGTDTWPVVTINAMPIGTIVLDDGTFWGITVTVAELIFGAWEVNTAIQAVLDGLAPGQDFTDGVDTWPVLSFTAMPTGEVVLDNGVPGGLTITYQDIASGTWTLVP